MDASDYCREIEAYHEADMKLYRRALQMREERLFATVRQ